MATHGELTVVTLKQFINCFPDDTKVVLGNKDTADISLDCHANTYYPPDKKNTQCGW